MIVLIVIGLIGLVVLVVGAPLRAAGGGPRPEAAPTSPGPGGDGGALRDELDAAREAKYREIRDAEMDFRTGKLSEADYGLLDADLRAEALEILDRLQALDAAEHEPPER